MKKEQYVCLVCGFNMVGFHPDACPFCGARKERFITAEECSARFKVVATPVNEKVTRLNSQPALGYEHAAYRIETGQSALWIDCPSTFDASLPRVDTILFTHHHFLGASNLYRQLFTAEVHIHQADSRHEICRPFSFDSLFDQDFIHHGIEAFHIDGHTPRVHVLHFRRDAVYLRLRLSRWQRPEAQPLRPSRPDHCREPPPPGTSRWATAYHRLRLQLQH